MEVDGVGFGEVEVLAVTSSSSSLSLGQCLAKKCCVKSACDANMSEHREQKPDVDVTSSLPALSSPALPSCASLETKCFLQWCSMFPRLVLTA